MISKVLKYYPSCYLDLFRYNRMLRSFRVMNEPQKRFMAQDILQFACQHGIGWYVCPEIEDYYLSVAENISVPVSDIYAKQSFIHVLTYLNTFGGHSRIVERWIDSAPENEIHSVVILNQGLAEKYPQKNGLLHSVNKHNGELINLSDLSQEEKSLELRKIASKYEYVISHIHMFDPTAIIAFGSDDFKRPVIHFNHADDKFWCGASVIDMVADLRDNNWSKRFRGIDNKWLLRLPVERKIIERTKVESRKRLGIPLNEKIIMTCGQICKYTPINNMSFYSIVAPVLINNINIKCYCIGVSPNDFPNWNDDKVVLLGNIDYGQDYFDYINSCDIFINSFPIGGGTALLDALQCHKPCLSYSILNNSSVGNMIQGVQYFDSLKNFRKEIDLLLNDEIYAEKKSIEQYNLMLKYHSLDLWIEEKQKMIKAMPKKHMIKRNLKVNHKITDDSILINIWFRHHSSLWNCIMQKLIRIIK